LLYLFPLLIPGKFLDVFALTVTGFFAEIKVEPLMIKKKNQHWGTIKVTSGKSSVEDVMRIKIIT
jgi:hypothetical protein